MKKEIILQWLKRAEEDIKVVQQLLKTEEIITSAICFHSQQAVEKYLKAYLTLFDVSVRKTHDLEVILDLCIKQDKDFGSLDREKISRLTFYSVEIRYPDEFYIPSLEESKESYHIALTVKNFIFGKLNIKEEDLK